MRGTDEDGAWPQLLLPERVERLAWIGVELAGTLLFRFARPEEAKMVWWLVATAIVGTLSSVCLLVSAMLE